MFVDFSLVSYNNNSDDNKTHKTIGYDLNAY